MKRISAWISDHQQDTSKMLFAVAGLYGVMCATLYPPQWGAPVEMVKLAENLASHGTFANPFYALDTGFTAANPPLYPWLLSLLMRLLHHSPLIYLVVTIGCVVANALTAALLPRISFLLLGEAIPGVIGSLFWIGAMPIWPSWDVSFTVLGLVAFSIQASVILAAPAFAASRTIITGALAALILLLNPSTLLIMVPLVLVCAYQMHGPPRLRLVTSSALLGFMVLSLGAWGLRNYYRLGGFTIRTNLGMTLYASNNDCAEATMFKNQLNACHGMHHPNESLQEAQLLLSTGEIRYDRKRIADTKTWIAEHPRRFATLTWSRVLAFWFPAVESLSRQAPKNSPAAGWITYRNRCAWIMRIATALSIPGFIILAYTRKWVAWFIAVTLVVYPLLYYIVVADMRYRYPIFWLSALLAGYMLYEVAERQSRRQVDHVA